MMMIKMDRIVVAAVDDDDDDDAGNVDWAASLEWSHGTPAVNIRLIHYVSVRSSTPAERRPPTWQLVPRSSPTARATTADWLASGKGWSQRPVRWARRRSTRGR